MQVTYNQNYQQPLEVHNYTRMYFLTSVVRRVVSSRNNYKQTRKQKKIRKFHIFSLRKMLSDQLMSEPKQVAKNRRFQC